MIDGRFQKIRRLGEGSTSVVHLALDEETGAQVALKVVTNYDPDAAPLLAREFRIAAHLEHANIVQFFEVLSTDSGPVVVMEHVDGEPFPGPAVDARDVVRQLADALATIHDAGLVHGDIKPSNVLVRSNGDCVLIDLGFATHRGALLPAVGLTPAFSAPEVDGLSPAEAAGDVYSLAKTVLHAFPQVDVELQAVLQGMMVRNPAQRLTARQVTTLLDARQSSHRGASAAMFGRDALLLSISEHFASSALPLVVSLVGRPGTGRSALLAAAVPAGGVLVRCTDRDQTSLSLVEAIAESLAALVDARVWRPLARALPGLGQRTGIRGTPAVIDMDVVVDGLTDLCVAAGVAIAIDDAHVADIASAAVIGDVLAALAAQGCAQEVLLTSTVSGGPFLSALHYRLARSNVVMEQLDVPPLTSTDAESMLRQRGVETQIPFERHGGLPALIALEAIESARGHHQANEDEQTVLRVLALASGPLAFDVLTCVAGLSADAVLRAVWQLRRHGWVQTGVVDRRPYAVLRHEGVAHIALGGLDPSDHPDIHAAIATHLPASDGPRRAYHLATSGQPEAACDVLREHIAAHSQSATPRLVVAWFDQLATIGPLDEPERIAHAESLMASGLPRRAAQSLTALAEATTDQQLRNERLRRAAAILLASGHESLGLGAMDRVLADAGVRVPRTLIGQFIRLSVAYRSTDHDLVYAPLDRPVPDINAHAIDALNDAVNGLAMWRPFRSAAAAADLLHRSLECGDANRLLRSLNIHLIQTSGYQYDPASSQRIADVLRDVHRHATCEEADVLLHGALAGAAWMEGRPAEHRTHILRAREGLGSVSSASLWIRDSVAVFGVAAAAAVGDVTALRREVPALLRDGLQRDDRYLTAQVRVHGEAWMHLAEDRADGARRALDLALTDWRDAGRTQLALFAWWMAVRIELYKGDVGSAAELFDRETKAWRFSAMMSLSYHKAMNAVVGGLVAAGVHQAAPSRKTAKRLQRAIRTLSASALPLCHAHADLLRGILDEQPTTFEAGRAVLRALGDAAGCDMPDGVRNPAAMARAWRPVSSLELV